MADKSIQGIIVKIGGDASDLGRIVQSAEKEAAGLNNCLLYTSNNDIRCLFNHDSGLVLGRTGNQTLTLAEDEHGLKGSVRINPNDKQAMDIYARVERGDIAGCSFGFSPVAEDTEWRDDGTVHWMVKEADTAEVSICTFPAYPQTSVMARKQGFEEARRQRMEQEKEALKKRLEALK